jgi:ATP-binding cassette, subfamily F, member 3
VYSNEKFSYRAQSMEKRITKLESQRTFVSQPRRAEVALETSVSTSACVLDINGLDLFTPGGQHLTTIEKLSIRRGERVAIVGRNGCGKSTLMRAIVAQCTRGAPSREIFYNPSLQIGYYDQNLSHFTGEERVVEAVLTRTSLSQQRVVSELVRAGFQFERHAKLIATLSGGERARLTFLILKLIQPHMLVLDEPTNHLDVEGIEQLEDTLTEDGATVLLVSHDRRFLERVATRVIEVPKQGK